MKEIITGRFSFATTFSVAVHVGIAMFLIGMPQHLKQVWETVDIELVNATPEPAPEPESEPTPEPEPEPKVPKKKRKPKAVPKPEPTPMPEPVVPDEPLPPPEAREAPPAFDLGDNTFARNDNGAAWTLARSEGNTKYAGVQKDNTSVRGTAPKRSNKKAPLAPLKEASLFNPVPSKGWSRKPEPLNSGSRMPEYPFEARRDGVEGKVRLRVSIGKDGNVKMVRILNDPGKGLGVASKKHALKKKWRPALDKNGNAVDAVIVWTFTFILDS
jgi:TonB family protein